MDGEDGKQQAHLVLADKLFLLTQPDVDDIDKVRLRQEVLAAVVADGTYLHTHSYICIVILIENVDCSCMYRLLGFDYCECWL